MKTESNKLKNFLTKKINIKIKFFNPQWLVNHTEVGHTEFSWDRKLCENSWKSFELSPLL